MLFCANSCFLRAKESKKKDAYYLKTNSLLLSNFNKIANMMVKEISEEPP